MTTPTCWACGGPWFEPDQFGTLRCCDCDADYGKKPASRRISANSPTDALIYNGTPFEGRLDSCRACPMPDAADLWAPFSRKVDGDRVLCWYECDREHRWHRGYMRRGMTPTPKRPAPKTTGKPAAKNAAGKPGATVATGFRAHVRKMASEGDIIAQDIADDRAFPFRLGDPDAFAAYFKKTDASESALDALDALWDGYRFGKPKLRVESIHSAAKILVETFKHYTVLMVNRDELVDRLQMGMRVPVEAGNATVGIPVSVRDALDAFKPVTLAMFKRIQYRGPWSHELGPRYYNLHVPTGYERVAVNALRAAELHHEPIPLRALLDKLSLETSEDTAIYQWFDLADAPIYYGITKDMHSRQSTHARRGAWGTFAATCKVERLPTRDAALAREKELIQRDRPVFNRQHNNSPEARERVVEYLTMHGRLDLLV